KITPCATKDGTIVVSENIFYNNQIRKQSLDPRDEYNHIFNLIRRLSIHFSDISFSVKKSINDKIELKTPGKDSDKKELIAMLFDHKLKEELISIFIDSQEPSFILSGFVTHANFSRRKYEFTLFVNNRLVENEMLKKSILSTYSPYLPKSSYPFVYLSFSIPFDRIDVNVHPSKSRVHFIDEQQIISAIVGEIGIKILEYSKSRNFTLSQSISQPVIESCQATTKKVQPISFSQPIKVTSRNDPYSSRSSTMSSYPQNYVRTNPKALKIDTFSSNMKLEESKAPSASNLDVQQKNIETVSLASIDELNKELEEKKCEKVIHILENSSYIGIVSFKYILMQFETQLMLVNSQSILSSFLYQSGLKQFSSFKEISLQPGFKIRDLLEIGLSLPESGYHESDGPKNDMIEYAIRTLNRQIDMLSEYFMIKITDQELVRMPLLCDKLQFPVHRLPIFFLKLLVDVDWCVEKQCFKDILQLLANFYCEPAEGDDGSLKSYNTSTYFETVFLPGIKTNQNNFSASYDLMNDFKKLTTLPELYRVFERC
ncbi:MAG: DNA mismatch repair protein, partial [Paramarteilia canceri]